MYEEEIWQSIAPAVGIEMCRFALCSSVKELPHRGPRVGGIDEEDAKKNHVIAINKS
jgi:hypothetical protein